VNQAVKLRIIISASGKVASVEPLGGHPQQIHNATLIVAQWTFAPDQRSTTAVVTFQPE
jgi:hypothetical protein